MLQISDFSSQFHFHWKSDIFPAKYVCITLNKKNFFFQKEKADLEKLKLILKPEEMSATVNLQTPHERMQHLEQVYQELEAHYKKTIERIAAT